MGKEEKTKMLVQVANMIAKMGWSLAVPNQSPVKHILIGEDEELESLAQDLPYDYDIMKKDLEN